MDDNYYNEVLPRWKFWKERLVEQLKAYQVVFKENNSEHFREENSEFFKDLAEIIEKTKEVETAENLKRAAEEIGEFTYSLMKNLEEYEYAGVDYYEGVCDQIKLESWLNINDLVYKIKTEIKKTK